jgi:hypothetical protein
LTAAGIFKAGDLITVPNCMLPTLSNNQTFEIELMVVPKEHTMKYGVILGQDGMRTSLDLDTSIQENAITWGEKTISMVPRDYWTPERIKQNKHRFVKKQVSNDGKESINSPSKFKSKETIASELPREPREAVETIPLVEKVVRELIDEAHATEALLKTNYVKPDLQKPSRTLFVLTSTSNLKSG